MDNTPNMTDRGVKAQDFALEANEMAMKRLKAQGHIDPRLRGIIEPLVEFLADCDKYDALFQIELARCKAALSPIVINPIAAKPIQGQPLPRRTWDD